MQTINYTVRLLPTPANVVNQILTVKEFDDGEEVYAQSFTLGADCREKVVTATADNDVRLSLQYQDANGNVGAPVDHTFVARYELVQTPVGFGQITNEGYGQPREPEPAPVVVPEVTPEPAPVVVPDPVPAPAEPAAEPESTEPQPETPAA